MIRFNALGVQFSMPMLTLIIPVLSLRLGMKLPFTHILLALTVHESAHILVARLVHVQITEINLLPFGGSARMENPYGLRPVQLAAVAAAGPASNLICAAAFIAMARSHILPMHIAASHVRINLTLFAFNLLPALPLDGGRLLYALLHRPLGQHRAMSIGILCGKLLAVAFICAAIHGFFSSGKLNLSLLLAAVFILSSAPDEQEALVEARVRSLLAEIISVTKQPVTFS